MKFSRKIDYALVFLSALKDSYGKSKSSVLGVREISKKFGVPYSFMEKLAVELKRAGIVDAQKGRGGGYALVRNPKKITMLEIINIFERPKIMKCLEGGEGGECFLSAACPTKKRWQALDKKILKVFEETALSEI